MATPDKELFKIVDALAEVQRSSGQQYDTFRVRGKIFGYFWPRTQTVGLKQTLSEQLALVAERPDVFEMGEAISPPAYHAWAVKKGNRELLAFLNDFLAEQRENGNLYYLQEKWLGSRFEDLPWEARLPGDREIPN